MHIRRRVLNIALSLTVGASTPAYAADGLHASWTEECQATTRFHDGDTFTCVPVPGSDRSAFGVRPAAADAPETGQANWRVARDRLRALARPGTKVACYKTDRYKREVCKVRVPGGADLAEQLLIEGLTWHFIKYAYEETAEEQARY